jgi:hypothetical protein
MTRNEAELSGTQPLTRGLSLVIGALALCSCGQASSSRKQESTGGTATGGRASSDDSGGSLSSGGGFVTVPSTGGTVDIDPGSFECPPAQWDCTATPPACGTHGYLLPEGCECDTNRPLDESACADGQALVCRNGQYAGDGRPLAMPFGFECSCTVETDNCRLACDEAFPPPGVTPAPQTDCSGPSPGRNTILCDCGGFTL